VSQQQGFKGFFRVFSVAISLCIAPAVLWASQVTIKTPLGSFDVELFDNDAPNTVANFLSYVHDGSYKDSFIHRSAKDINGNAFVIQGGAFTAPNDTSGIGTVPTKPPIANEFKQSNLRGTIAMAKTSDPDSATSQWFINLEDNSGALDNPNNSGGFTVFGRVMGNGMDVVDAIAALPTFNFGGSFPTLPLINFVSGGLLLRNELVFTTLTDPNAPPSFTINRGLTGTWFNRNTDGQGWLIDVYNQQLQDGSLVRQIFLAWFTYDVNEPPADETAGFGSSQHRWFTAATTPGVDVSGDTAQLSMGLNSNGVFNDSRMTTPSTVGSITLKFTDCAHGHISWTFLADGSPGADPSADGQADIERLTPDAFCQGLAQ